MLLVLVSISDMIWAVQNNHEIYRYDDGTQNWISWHENSNVIYSIDAGKAGLWRKRGLLKYRKNSYGAADFPFETETTR